MKYSQLKVHFSLTELQISKAICFVNYSNMGKVLLKIYGYVTVAVKKVRETTFRLESDIYRGRG